MLWAPPHRDDLGLVAAQGVDALPRHLALNMFCQCSYPWMYVIPAADL